MNQYHRQNRKTQNRTEAELVIMLNSFLRESGYNVRTEVPNLGQSIDVVATKNRYVTAIEAKRSDWRRALAQCRAHELVADYVCVAVGLKTISDGLLLSVSDCGYGLLGFAEDPDSFQWIVSPKKNDRIWAPRRKAFYRSMRSIAYASD